MDLPLCECGCGERVSKPWNRYIRWHHSKGRKHTQEAKRRVSESLKGNKRAHKAALLRQLITGTENRFCACGCSEYVAKPGNKFVEGHVWRGRKQSEEAKRKQSERMKGRVLSPENLQACRQGKTEAEWKALHEKACEYCGRQFTTRLKGKRRESQRFCSRACGNRGVRREPSEYVTALCDYCGRAFQTRVCWAQKTKKHTYCCVSCKDAHHSELMQGSGNPHWMGGKSFEPYSPEFNGVQKVVIRERDGFACRLCGVAENGGPHACHHINYVKTHNHAENLITLCFPCHGKTNYNRAFWKNLFQAQMKMGLT